MNNVEDNKAKLSSSNVLQMYCKVLPAQFFLYALNCLRLTINGTIVGNAMDSLSLAAIALYAPYACIMAAVYAIISYGCTILCGHKLGRGDIKGEHEVFATAVWISGAAAFAVGVLMLVFAKPLALFLGSGEEVLVQTMAYIRGQAIGVIPSLMIPVLASYIQLNNRPKQIFIYAIIQVITLLIFVPTAVYVFGGGLFEASLASSLSAYVPLIYLAVYIKKEKLATDIVGNFNISHVGRMLFLGIPAAAIQLFTGVRDVIINNQVMFTGGTDAIAAMAILSSTWLIIDAIVYGSGNSVRILSSVFYGERDRSAQIKLFGISSGIGMVLTVITGIIYVLLSGRLSALFGADANIASLTFQLILIYCIGRTFTLMVVIFISMYQSCNHTLTAFLCNLAAFFIFPICACFLLYNTFGVNGIWCANYIIGTGLMFLLIPVVIGKFSCKLSRVLLLDEEDGAHLHITLNNVDDAHVFSERVQRFCKEHNAGEKRSYMCGLCLEEMAVIIFEQGYGKKSGTVDIAVHVKDDSVTMRFRDDAPEFNVTDRFAGCKEIKKEDPAANIGIRIVMKSAESASYNSVFGTNTLLLKF